MPINVECRLSKIIELHHADFFVGEIVGVYIEKEYLVNDKPDVKSMDPLLYEDGLGNYWKIGEFIAKAFTIGREFKPKPE